MAPSIHRYQNALQTSTKPHNIPVREANITPILQRRETEAQGSEVDYPDQEEGDT